MKAAERARVAIDLPANATTKITGVLASPPTREEPVLVVAHGPGVVIVCGPALDGTFAVEGPLPAGGYRVCGLSTAADDWERPFIRTAPPEGAVAIEATPGTPVHLPAVPRAER